MNFQQSYNFLLSLSNLPRREYMKDPNKCDVYLKREQFFLDILGNPEKKIPHYIHVTGTSGKGSVCAFLHAILMASGKRTGLLASPHPTQITERWKVNDEFMSEDEFTRLTRLIIPKLNTYLRTTPYDMISFGEIVTSLGLLHFAQKKVDWVVAEVGCGGRYDETNIIPRKDAAVITNIGLDHTKTLGPTKAVIAYEKAGIISKGTTVFTMEKDQKIRAVIEKEAKRAGATMSRNTYHVTRNNGEMKQMVDGMRGRSYKVVEMNIEGTKFNYKGKDFFIKATGEHQARNAILCIEVARFLGVKEEAIVAGLAAAKQPLRMEVVQKRPLVILDGAHNPDKMKTTVASVQQFNPAMSGIPLRRDNLTMKQWNNLHLVLGFSNDKNVLRMLKQLNTLNPKTVACTRNTVNSFRKAADPRVVRDEFRKLNPRAKTELFLDPWEAFLWAKKRAKKDDLILVTGSIFMSGEVRGRLRAGA